MQRAVRKYLKALEANDADKAAALFTAVLAMTSLGLTFGAGKRLLAAMPRSSDLDFTASINLKALMIVFVMVVPLALIGLFNLWAMLLLFLVAERFLQSAREARARWAAAESPVKPAPMTAKSTWAGRGPREGRKSMSQGGLPQG